MKDISTILILFLWLPGISLAEVTIENNGYRGVEVVIHEDVPEDIYLLDTLKAMLNRSSSWLYKTTNQRAYFEDITIVVPSTWSSKPEYTKVPENDYYYTASLRIGPPNPTYNHTPYTFQPGGCGEFGRFIHMTPEFILNYEDSPSRPQTRKSRILKSSGLAKIFVHEWFHLRYGVFNEFPTHDSRFPQFYLKNNSTIAPSVCPANLGGRAMRSSTGKNCTVDRAGNLIGDCIFVPSKTTNNAASIMYIPQLPQATGPCEDDDTNDRLHNSNAPNEQNLKCNKRSIRNVMESGPDFRNNRNPTPQTHPNTTSNIKILHLQNNTFPGYVLVLDVSSSMSGKPWEQLKEATSRAIKYKAKPSCPVGIVSYSSSSKILAPLTPINDNTRNELLTKIPASVGGYTAIGQGLLSALQVLREGNKPVDKGKIILITDGEENTPPNIVDVTQQLQAANVIVYGLAFGAQASQKIEDLSRITGGKGWFFNPAHLTQSLDSMLDEIFQNCGPVKDQPIINKNGAFKLLAGDSKTGIFHVESGGIKTSIFVSYEYPSRTPNNGKEPFLTVTSPSGRMYNAQSPEYKLDQNLKSVMLDIANPESGSWTYHFKNQDNDDINLNLMVTSEKGTTKDDPIRVKSYISAVNLTYPHVPKIYAEVYKKQIPVLNATVTANVFKPNGEKTQIPLKDDGRGADANANDGVYSEYYTIFNGNGRYSIDITVESNGGAGIATNSPAGLSGAPDLSHFPTDLDLENSTDAPASEFNILDFKRVDELFETSAIYDPTKANREPKITLEKVEDFERFATAGTFILEEWVPKDLIPPGKITDLRVKAHSIDNRTVTLEWTSAGDDMYIGQGTAIEVRYHYDATQLVQSFESAFSNFTVLDGSLQPPEAYQSHRLSLQLPSEDEMPFPNTSQIIQFAVRTFDEEGNVGEISNTVFVNFEVFQPPVIKPKPSCDKYVKLFKHEKKTSPKLFVMNAIKNGKGPWKFYNVLAKYSNGKLDGDDDDDDDNKMKLEQIPTHCWPAITDLENLPTKTSTTSSVLPPEDGEYGIENIKVFSKDIWRMWWKPRH